jgi:SAM-dependent methyltransferase
MSTNEALPDRYTLYEASVQDVDREVQFLGETFRRHAGRMPLSLREDFCGTASLSCAWVASHPSRRAVAIDLDPEPLDWGQRHNVSKLTDDQVERIELVLGDAVDTVADPVDLCIGLNFSWFILAERTRLLAWLRNVRRHLAPDGLLILDMLGGPQCQKPGRDPAREEDGFDYIWELVSFDPITHKSRCAIHFDLHDGPEMTNAFEYGWRLYGVPEVRDILVDAGYSKSVVWWEGIDPITHEGDGRFAPAEQSQDYDSFVCYLVASP